MKIRHDTSAPDTFMSIHVTIINISKTFALDPAAFSMAAIANAKEINVTVFGSIPYSLCRRPFVKVSSAKAIL